MAGNARVLQFSDLPRGRPGTPEASGQTARALWLPPDVLARSSECAYESGKVVLGAVMGGDDLTHIGVRDNRHLMTIAGTRAGKGTSVIVPNLLLYPGSVLVLDPKGENATLTAARRGQGEDVPAGGLSQKVYVIDPFGVAQVPDHYRAGFNPFDQLEPASKTFIDDCDSIADALIVKSSGVENANYFDNTAKMILRGVIAWVAAYKDLGMERSLATVRALLFRPESGSRDGTSPPSLGDLTLEMVQNPEVAHGLPAETGAALVGMSDQGRGAVMATIHQNLAFLQSPPMIQALSSGLRAPDLKAWKDGRMSIYLCLPATRLHSHRRFFRLFLNLLLTAVEQAGQPDQHDTGPPAIMFLDEMHVLGRMESLEVAAGLIAGYGVRIWSIVQDIHQLRDIYKGRWETFLGNAGLLQVFGLNDLGTLEYISKRLGTTSVLSVSTSEISRDDAARGFSGQSSTAKEASLLTPDEIAYFFSSRTHNQLVMLPGIAPMFMQRLPYYHPFYQDYLPTHD